MSHGVNTIENDAESNSYAIDWSKFPLIQDESNKFFKSEEYQNLWMSPYEYSQYYEKYKITTKEYKTRICEIKIEYLDNLKRNTVEEVQSVEDLNNKKQIDQRRSTTDYVENTYQRNTSEQNDSSMSNNVERLPLPPKHSTLTVKEVNFLIKVLFQGDELLKRPSEKLVKNNKALFSKLECEQADFQSYLVDASKRYPNAYFPLCENILSDIQLKRDAGIKMFLSMREDLYFKMDSFPLAMLSNLSQPTHSPSPRKGRSRVSGDIPKLIFKEKVANNDHSCQLQLPTIGSILPCVAEEDRCDENEEEHYVRECMITHNASVYLPMEILLLIVNLQSSNLVQDWWIPFQIKDNNDLKSPTIMFQHAPRSAQHTSREVYGIDLKKRLLNTAKVIPSEDIPNSLTRLVKTDGKTNALGGNFDIWELESHRILIRSAYDGVIEDSSKYIHMIIKPELNVEYGYETRTPCEWNTIWWKSYLTQDATCIVARCCAKRNRLFSYEEFQASKFDKTKSDVCVTQSIKLLRGLLHRLSILKPGNYLLRHRKDDTELLLFTDSNDVSKSAPVTISLAKFFDVNTKVHVVNDSKTEWLPIDINVCPTWSPNGKRQLPATFPSRTAFYARKNANRVCNNAKTSKQKYRNRKRRLISEQQQNL